MMKPVTSQENCLFHYDDACAVRACQTSLGIRPVPDRLWSEWNPFWSPPISSDHVSPPASCFNIKNSRYANTKPGLSTHWPKQGIEKSLRTILERKDRPARTFADWPSDPPGKLADPIGCRHGSDPLQRFQFLRSGAGYESFT